MAILFLATNSDIARIFKWRDKPKRNQQSFYYLINASKNKNTNFYINIGNVKLIKKNTFMAIFQQFYTDYL